ncbi:unnamed protein product, partial [Adineta steineri]
MIGTLDDRKQWTALHYAVYCNNVNLCRWLTSKNSGYRCNVNVLGGNGENVLHVVAQSKWIWANEPNTENPMHIIELLIKDCGANVNHADDEGRTPLHLAAMQGRRLYFEYLIENKAKVDVRLQVLEYLVEKVGIEVDAIGDRRLTPLHIACECGHLDAVQYLIESGASTTLRNAQLFNCLEISIQKQHNEIVKYLLQLPNWREMMRNAQPIEATDAYDTPM